MSRLSSSQTDTRPIFFFDVDDCLYPRSLGVSKLMYDLLLKFVMSNLSLSEVEATELSKKYFEEYPLVALGLVKRHQIDPLLFNDQNDNALPLEDILSPDPELRSLLLKFDTSKVKLWLFTNAHITHGHRVVKLLGVEDLFEGITYCDYENGMWPIKPQPEMFAKAEKDAGAADSSQCFFVDDNPRNCTAAMSRGWQVVHILHSEAEVCDGMTETKCRQIQELKELHTIFPQFLKAEDHV